MITTVPDSSHWQTYFAGTPSGLSVPIFCQEEGLLRSELEMEIQVSVIH